jgi:Zn-finger nucleic acid-binding protein
MLYRTGCHGMLSDMQKFLPLLQVLREQRYRFKNSQAPRGIDPDMVLHYPLCKGQMDKHPYRGSVKMDMNMCGPCTALWLDRGVLGTIVAAYGHAWQFHRPLRTQRHVHNCAQSVIRPHEKHWAAKRRAKA